MRDDIPLPKLSNNFLLSGFPGLLTILRKVKLIWLKKKKIEYVIRGLVLTKVLWSRFCYYLHFIHEETKTQRG